MEILQKSLTSDLSAMKLNIINQSQQGNWYDAQRVYILKINDSQYEAISLNIFERMASFFYPSFEQSYLLKKFKEMRDKHTPIVKTVKVISSEALEIMAPKVSQNLKRYQAELDDLKKTLNYKRMEIREKTDNLISLQRSRNTPYIDPIRYDKMERQISKIESELKSLEDDEHRLMINIEKLTT